MDILMNTITKAVGWTIIHSLWQGAVVYILLIGLLKLYPKMSPGSKYNLSFSAMLGIFGWALFTFSNELGKSNDIIGSGHSYGLSRSIIDNLPSILDRSIPLLVMTYLIGICFHISSLIFDFYKVNRLRTIGLIDLTSDLQYEFSKLAYSLGITRKVQFNISSKVTVPIVVGYLKPIILFPVSVITQLDSRQLESIVIHELSHIRRNDYLLNLMKIFMETILFFNPFVLMTGKIINIEREQACDDLVVGMTNDPLVYVESLLEIQKLKYSQDRFSMAITGKNHHLLDRVKRLTNDDIKNSRIKQPLALLLILSSFCLIAWIPFELKRSIVPVTVIKKNEQSIKPGARQKIKKKESSIVTQNVAISSVRKSKPDKLPEQNTFSIAEGPNPNAAENITNQIGVTSESINPEAVATEKQKSNEIITQGHKIVVQTMDPDKKESKTPTDQYKSEPPERTTTGFLKPGNTPKSEQTTTIILTPKDPH